MVPACPPGFCTTTPAVHANDTLAVSLAPSVTVTFARQSAMDSRSQTVGLTAIRALRKPVGVTPSTLRADRILDEARNNAGPIHLMRIFGTCAGTALKYVSRPTPNA